MVLCILPLLFWGAAALAVGGATYVGLGKLADTYDKDDLTTEIRMKCPTALKLLIQEKKKTALNVGIFNNLVEEEPNETMRIEAGKEISDNIHVGQVIYL